VSLIEKVSSDLCPVSIMLAFLLSHGNKGGPLFQFRDGRPLTRQLFVVAVHDALQAAGVEAASYAGHSLRIRAASELG